MKIIKYQKLKTNKYKILLDNDETITLYDDIILKNSLLLTKEINDIDLLLKENEYFDAYNISLKYISRKLRTKKEINSYLKNKFDIEIINDTIKRLEKEGYLNEDIYIKAYINDQINLTNNGYFKILRDLKNNGLNEDKILDYLDSIDNDIWIEKAKKIIDKQVKSNNKYSSKRLKEKLLYDLNNKGYNNSDIIELVNKIDVKDDENILEKNYNTLYTRLSRKYNKKELELQLLNKLMSKGFNYNEVKEIINKKKSSY